MGGTQALIKWGPHLMDQEVGEIFWLQFDILEKDRTSWMMRLLKYQIEGYLKIVENFLCQLLFLSVGAKGLGLENEGTTWNLSSSDKVLTYLQWINLPYYLVSLLLTHSLHQATKVQPLSMQTRNFSSSFTLNYTMQTEMCFTRKISPSGVAPPFSF